MSAGQYQKWDDYSETYDRAVKARREGLTAAETGFTVVRAGDHLERGNNALANREGYDGYGPRNQGNNPHYANGPDMVMRSQSLVMISR